MVAVAAAQGAPALVATRRGLVCTLGALGVLVLGAVLRIALGGTGVGDRSALIMSILLSLGAWLGTRALSGPRTALIVLGVLTLLFDLAALAPRNAPVYDDVQAFYRTDQAIDVHVRAATPASTIEILVQPVFEGDAPRFGIAGEVNGAASQWTCSFTHRMQWVSLPLATQTASADAQLHLIGSPSREGDYLLVYASSRQGGFLISLSSTVGEGDTRCALM